MEKISGILPANSRLTTVDLKGSGSVRGGMPAFGRKVGVTAAAEKQIALEKDVTAKALGQHRLQMDLREKNLDPKVQIVQDMTDKFFGNKAARTEQAHAEVDNIDLQLPAAYDMKIERPNFDTKESSAAESELNVVELKDLAKEVPEANEDEVAIGYHLDVRV